MVLFYGCKVTYFFAYMQMCLIFYASCFKNFVTMSRQKTIMVAEAMLISRVKKTFINNKF